MSSDQELIELINGGDTDAFEVLYRRYRDWVYHLAWRFTGNQQDALDVLQETFTYLLGKFPGFSLTASMTTFLYPVVRHISLTVRSKNRRFASDEKILSEISMPESKESDSSRSELAAVLAVLPDEQREVLLMRFFDGMNLQEIATALNIPAGTVKSRLHNALKGLRDDRRTKDYFLE
ncbi:MAG: sigma-70 family RNA polymerase sigma factor [Planctomycetes bacterium]|nr:sigma-70 family RNA polymerase sigma factor [Planctomycetota bacterium]